MKKRIVGGLGLIATLIVLILLQVPNHLRYEIEDIIGNPQTYFYDVKMGVMLDDVEGGYDEEINLDEHANVSINLAKYNKDKVNVFIYGKYVNSADPLVVVLNEVAYNGQPEGKLSNFYSSNYINKHFVINLTKFIKEGENRLVISTGNVTERYDLNFVKWSNYVSVQIAVWSFGTIICRLIGYLNRYPDFFYR